jgi:hypothetical protein
LVLYWRSRAFHIYQVMVLKMKQMW